MTISPSIRLSQTLYDQARQAAAEEGRSVAGQVEFWAKVARSGLDNPELPTRFIAQSLMSLTESRDETTDFVPRYQRS